MTFIPQAGLDYWFPPCGPCAICGGPDKRHRLGDALYGAWRGGDSMEFIARDYDLRHLAVIANNVAYELAVRGHRRRPFRARPITGRIRLAPVR